MASPFDSTTAPQHTIPQFAPLLSGEATIADMVALQNAYRIMFEVGSGLICQPRFEDGPRGHNAAGDALRETLDSLGAAMTALDAQLRRSRPCTVYEVGLRENAIIMHAAACGAEFQEMVAVVGDLASKH